MKLHLIQSRELFGPVERQEELRECWRRNEGLFDEYTHPEGRPTFAELFDLCKSGQMNVIANADIYFDRIGIKQMARFFVDYIGGRAYAQDPVLALSRWDVDPTGVATLWNNSDSQDTWVCFGRVGGGPRIDAPYSMGVPGCDNALIHALERASCIILNPSKTIRTYHLHLSNYRSYLDGATGQGRGGKKLERVPPPYGFSKPTEL